MECFNVFNLLLDLVNENIWMAENNNSLTLDDFRSDKYSELPLLDYVVFTITL